MTVLGRTCKWCREGITRNNKTGLCSECRTKYTAMVNEVMGKVGYSHRDTCHCGKPKDRRSKECHSCFAETRRPTMRDMGGRFYGNRHTGPIGGV